MVVQLACILTCTLPFHKHTHTRTHALVNTHTRWLALALMYAAVIVGGGKNKNNKITSCSGTARVLWREGQTEIVRMLLKAGAEAAVTDADGECALHKVRLCFLAIFSFG